jgi:hypothetical protein
MTLGATALGGSGAYAGSGHSGGSHSGSSHHGHYGHGSHWSHYQHRYGHRYAHYYHRYPYWHHNHYAAWRYQRPYSSNASDDSDTDGAASAPAASRQPCNCLTKEYLPDGNVMFKDLCTKEEAMMTQEAPSPASAKRGFKRTTEED